MSNKSEINKAREKARKILNYYEKYDRYHHHVHHKDGNPFNNNPENLEILCIKNHFKKHKNFGTKWGRPKRQTASS